MSGQSDGAPAEFFDRTDADRALEMARAAMDTVDQALAAGE